MIVSALHFTIVVTIMLLVCSELLTCHDVSETLETEWIVSKMWFSVSWFSGEFTTFPSLSCSIYWHSINKSVSSKYLTFRKEGSNHRVKFLLWSFIFTCEVNYHNTPALVQRHCLALFNDQVFINGDVREMFIFLEFESGIEAHTLYFPFY